MNGGKQNPMRMFIMFPMLFLMGKVDFENETILFSARAAYLACQVLSLLLGMYIKKQVEAKNDQRKIYVPAPQSPFDQSPNYEQTTETTYVDHEKAKAAEFIKQTLIGAAIASFVHFRMGVNQVLLIQAVMTPLNLYDNPLVQAYILGKREGRIWNERLEGEDAPSEESAEKTAKSKKKQMKSALMKLNPEEAIANALKAGADADFDELWDAIKGDVNVCTEAEKCTALMVACGSPIDTDEFIQKVIKAGANVTAADGDGWTALHWSAYHGRPEAAETLLETCSAKQREALLTTEDNERRTPMQLAAKEGNQDVVEVLERFSPASAKEATEDESELRQRKPQTSVEDVD